MATEIIKVEVCCEKGHKQTLTIQGQTRSQVELFAGLLDGSSPCFMFKPGPESPIGKCCICGSQFTATVLEPESPNGQ